jgi:glycosyltransferase involved in cell wall biosynthesis
MANELIAISAPDLQGGIGRNLVNLSRELIDRGYRVALLLETFNGPYRAQIASGIEQLVLRTSHPWSGIPQMAAYLLRRRPSIVLTAVARHTELALRAHSLARTGTRIFAQIHDTYGVALRRIDPNKAAKRIAKLRRYYPRCDGILAVSHGVAQDFSDLTGIALEQIKVIYNPVVTPELERQAMERPDHPWFDTPETPVIVFVGRLCRQKNPQLLLEAYLRIRDARDCRLTFIGDGEERDELQSLARRAGCDRDVAFLGERQNPYPFMRTASVLALSSDHEGFGNVLVEAMAVGTPVVATDCPSGPREILEDGRYGKLVPRGDPEALAAAISDTLEAPIAPDILRARSQDFTAGACATSCLQSFGV